METSKSKPHRAKYSDADWKDRVEASDKYESKRFGRSSGGQKKNRREQAMVRKFLQGLPNDRLVLDVPAGMGRFSQLIVESGHRPVSADLNWGRTLDARHRLETPVAAMQADIMRLPLKENSVDAVICFRLCHHLTSEQILQALRELRRVAGCAFVTFYSTASIKYWKKKLRGKDVSGKYYPARLVEKLSAQAGWKTCKHNEPFDFLHSLHSLELHR